MKIERETYSVPECARRLGISRNSAYEAVARGDLPAIKIGRRLLVSKVQFEKLLAGESVNNSAAKNNLS